MSSGAQRRPLGEGGAVRAAALVVREAFLRRPDDGEKIADIVNEALEGTGYSLSEWPPDSRRDDS